jgi:flagellin
VITVNDDIEIFGFLGTKTTAASATDSAKETAVKVNNLTGETGVKAYAKTYATVYSNSATAKTYSIKINGYETGNFVISSGDAESAVDAINQISGSTGVTASSADNKIVLFDSDGDDITVENTQGLSGHNDLRVQKLGEDGLITNTVGSVVSLATSGANDSTRVSGTLKLVSPNAFSIDQKAVNQTHTVTVGTLSDYNGSGGALTVGDGTTTVTLDYSGGAPGDIDVLLANIKAHANYGDLKFDVTKASGTTLLYTYKAAGVPTGTATFAATASNESIAAGAVGVASKGYYVENSAAASLKNLTQINVSTMIQAGDSISILDAALDKVAQMRSNLGAIENRLAYTVSNLMNIAEKTADARSRLDDADYALESARLAKAQVIQQAGTQMLKQANQLTQLVLDLLR